MGIWAGYVRVSRVGDREETLISPKLQNRQLTAWARGLGHDLVMLPAELDASGGDDARPILLAAIEQIERGELDGIVVAKLDRLSRSLAGSVAMLQRIEDAGGQVRSASEQLDASTVSGRTTRNILFSIAQGEREQKAEEFERAKADAIARGVYIAGRIPLGYRKGPDRRLVPDDAAPVVREAFTMRAEGASWRAIADHLASRLDRPFYGPTVRRMLHNRAYLGEARQGRHVNASAHEPLISRAAWEAGQVDHPRPPRGESVALLGGLIRCAGCSWRMSSTLQREGRAYRCRRRGARGVCPAPAYIAGKVVEPLVEASVLALVESAGVSATRRTDALTEGRDAVAEAEAELGAFQRETRASGVAPEHFASGLRERVDALEGARRDLATASLQAPAAPTPGKVRELWPELSVAERAHVLRRSLSVVWVRRGRASGAERIRLVDIAHRPPGLSIQGKPAQPVAFDWDADLEGEVRVAAMEDLGQAEGETTS